MKVCRFSERWRYDTKGVLDITNSKKVVGNFVIGKELGENKYEINVTSTFRRQRWQEVDDETERERMR